MTPADLPIDPRRLVFVGGLHRSGTTPITRILGSHSDVSTFHDTGVKEDEGQHLQSVYPAAREYGGAGRFAFDERSHLTEASPLCTAQNAARLLREWGPHWDLSRPHLVEKSPPNLVMSRFLAAAFPGSRLIVCVRHPIVVALSTAKWAGPFTRLADLVEHWVRAYTVFREDAAHLSTVHVVRYESLTRDPAGTLGEVRDYLGLTRDIAGDQVDASRSEGYLRRWEELTHSRAPWSQHAVRRLREKYAEPIASFGYDIDDLTSVADTPVVIRPGSADV